MVTDVRVATSVGHVPQDLARQAGRRRESLRLTRGWCVLFILALTVAVDLLIISRMVFLIVGVSSGVGSTVVDVTNPLVTPFLGDISRHIDHDQTFEPELLIAVAFYGGMGLLAAFLLLIAGLLARLFGFVLGVFHSEPRAPLPIDEGQEARIRDRVGR